MAKESLVDILKQLPEESYFNIISFGSNFQPMYPTSKKATGDVKEKTIIKIKEMSADMGGTEIFDPLSFVFESMELMEGFSRNIFLITDGGVSNTDQVIKLIAKNSNNAIMYTLGIG